MPWANTTTDMLGDKGSPFSFITEATCLGSDKERLLATRHPASEGDKVFLLDPTKPVGATKATPVTPVASAKGNRISLAQVSLCHSHPSSYFFPVHHRL
ncbi:hypothetical protein XPA_001345 [Xanthoria parietina]